MNEPRSPFRTYRKVPRLAALGSAIVLAVSLLFAGCTSSEEQSENVRPEIETLLEAYLPALGGFYETGDRSLLEGLAAEKEIFTVEQRVQELYAQGKRVRAELKELSVEGVDVYQYSNAYVNTFEVWDLYVLATGSERVISSDLDQPNRVRYQVKRGDDGWKVLHRQLVEDS
ncbi:MAG: IMS domain-containing protein [Acidobacteriota bacterium]